MLMYVNALYELLLKYENRLCDFYIDVAIVWVVHYFGQKKLRAYSGISNEFTIKILVNMKVHELVLFLV